MFIRKIVTSLALVAATAAPALAHATPNAGPPCILRDHTVVSVTPYKEDVRFGRNVYPQLRGAQVYIQAEPGLTAEWLQLTLQRHLAEMKGPAAMPDCAFDLDNVRVDVLPSGAGFWVRLIAPDTKTGEEVLRRAQLLASR